MPRTEELPLELYNLANCWISGKETRTVKLFATDRPDHYELVAEEPGHPEWGFVRSAFHVNSTVPEDKRDEVFSVNCKNAQNALIRTISRYNP